MGPLVGEGRRYLCPRTGSHPLPNTGSSRAFGRIQSTQWFVAGLAGTHVQGVLTDDDIEQLSNQVSPVECWVEQGGVLAMRPLSVHASSKSRSRLPRRVVHIE